MNHIWHFCVIQTLPENVDVARALVLTKTYTNSLLMLLNNLTQMRRMMNGQVWSIGEIDVEVSARSVAQGSRRRSSAPPQFALTKFPIPEEDTSTAAMEDSCHAMADGESSSGTKITGTVSQYCCTRSSCQYVDLTPLRPAAF